MQLDKLNNKPWTVTNVNCIWHRQYINDPYMSFIFIFLYFLVGWLNCTLLLYKIWTYKNEYYYKSEAKYNWAKFQSALFKKVWKAQYLFWVKSVFNWLLLPTVTYIWTITLLLMPTVASQGWGVQRVCPRLWPPWKC